MRYGAMICLFGAMVGRGSSIDIRGGEDGQEMPIQPKYSKLHQLWYRKL